MLTLLALSDCGHARQIRRESIAPVLRQWTLPRGSQHPRFRPLQQGVGGPARKPLGFVECQAVAAARRLAAPCIAVHRND